MKFDQIGTILNVAYLPLVAKRYKSFHKYEYHYEAESLNTLNGAINGPKVSCKVQKDLNVQIKFLFYKK